MSIPHWRYQKNERQGGREREEQVPPCSWWAVVETWLHMVLLLASQDHRPKGSRECFPKTWPGACWYYLISSLPGSFLSIHTYNKLLRCHFPRHLEEKKESLVFFFSFSHLSSNSNAAGRHFDFTYHSLHAEENRGVFNTASWNLALNGF